MNAKLVSQLNVKQMSTALPGAGMRVMKFVRRATAARLMRWAAVTWRADGKSGRTYDDDAKLGSEVRHS